MLVLVGAREEGGGGRRVEPVSWRWCCARLPAPSSNQHPPTQSAALTQHPPGFPLCRRKSHQLEVPALAALGKPVTITCPASDWSMTNVAPANSTQPSPVAAAIHELCLGRAECSLAVGGGGVRDTLLTLGAKLRVNGTSVQSQGALGGAVTVTCVPRGSAALLPAVQ